MSKKKTKGEEIKSNLSKPRIQKLLSFWLNSPGEWIPNSKLNEEFVKKYEHIIKQPSGIFYDSKEKKTYNQKPKPVYSHDSFLSRDLTKLVKLGILEKRKKPRSKGKPNTEYKPSKKYNIDLFRLGLKESLDSFSNDKIFLYDPPPVESSRKNMLCGFHDDLFKEMSKEEIEGFNICISKVNNYLNALDELKSIMKIRILNNPVEELKELLENKKIKQVQKKNNFLIWSNIYIPLLLEYEEGIDICKLNKKDFFRIFLLPSDKKEEIVQTKKANKEWSEHFFRQDLNKQFFLRSKIHFSFNDIFSIVNWAFTYRDKFALFMPRHILFSQYYIPSSTEDFLAL